MSAKHQQARQDRLEALYAEDGRHDINHPRHGLYTGLEQMARWRADCLATPLSIHDPWRPCMMRRVEAHLSDRDPDAALRELDALDIFLGISPARTISVAATKW